MQGMPDECGVCQMKVGYICQRNPPASMYPYLHDSMPPLQNAPTAVSMLLLNWLQKSGCDLVR